MKKIIITGSTGFIGKALSTKLEKDGYEVLGLSSSNGEIEDPHLFEPFNGLKIDHVFHLAAKTFVPDSWIDPSGFIRSNVNGTQNVLDFCHRNSLSLTYISAYLYGVPEKMPISESSKIVPNNPYALSKYMAEQLCSFYASYFNLPVTIVRPFNIYGPGQSGKFLIPFVIRQVIENDAIRVKNLEPKRDYLYIDDLISLLMKSMRSTPGLSIYNAGSGTSVSVKQVIEAVQELLGTHKPVHSENEVRINEIDDTIADIGQAKEKLGWLPSYSFNEGMRQTVKYWAENSR